MSKKKQEIAQDLFTENGYEQKGKKWVHQKSTILFQILITNQSQSILQLLKV